MFLKLIHQGLFRTIGDGNNLVSLCYIDNLIDGLLLAEKKKAEGQIYFLADSRPYTVNEIAATIAREQGKPITFIAYSPMGGNPIVNGARDIV